MGDLQPGKAAGTGGVDAAAPESRGPAPGKSTLVAQDAPKPGDPGGETPGAKPPVAPPALGADELVLSRQAAQATDAALPGFRANLVGKMREWGFGLDIARVHLATDGATKVVALTWDAAWGGRPMTREIPPSLDPIDAKLSVAAVHKLKGWSKVAAADQTRIDATLGGESNNSSIAARNNLRSQWASLGTKSEDDQGKALQAMLTDKAAQPYVVNEQVANARVAYTLSGATVVKNFEFKGAKADAEQYHAKYDDGVDVLITAPKAPMAAGLHQHSVQEAAEAAAFVPKAARSLITNVLLNVQVNPKDAYWATEYKSPGFHSYMTGGVTGVVTIYPDTKAQPSANYMAGTMQHETGHTWSKQHWGEDTTKGKWIDWKKAMDADKVSVSQYAHSSLNEDVAEAIQTFVSSKGTPKYDEYKAMVPNRYAILEKEYK